MCSMGGGQNLLILKTHGIDCLVELMREERGEGMKGGGKKEGRKGGREGGPVLTLGMWCPYIA